MKFFKILFKMFNVVVFHLPQAHTCSRVVFSIRQPLRVAYRLKSIIPGVCNLKVAPMKNFGNEKLLQDYKTLAHYLFKEVIRFY